MHHWQPLITGGERAPIAALLADLVSAIEVSDLDMRGQADRALVRAYLAEDGTVPDADDASGEALAVAVTQLAGTRSDVALFGGAAGIGWAVAHLAAGDGADHVCGRIDAALLAQLAGAWCGHYDLVAGLVGIGIYALERGGSGVVLAGRVLDHIAALAEPRAGGLAWHTPADHLPAWQRARAPDGYWNLGMAHGMPGIIA